MPAFALDSALDKILDDAIGADVSVISRDVVETWQVVCAWPVSGQYGPGTRILYYVLVAACVLARKAEWLRNACLAAALILPAVAAIHGIALAACHVDNKVDMDVYGAFQLCSIGILAAPVTVRLSSTYFNNPGRNTIFLWTGLILAGLLGLTVEFYRANPTTCNSAYVEDDSCLPCNPDSSSAMRGGATDNTYMIPQPEKLTFGAAMLLSAACCIPAVLSMASMWDKILQINWRARFGGSKPDRNSNERIDGTNGATVGEMKGVNAMIRGFLSVVEVPVFSAAVLAILILGEWNFATKQVSYQTEPIVSIGQWAPIVASGLAAGGSLYMVLAEDVDVIKGEQLGVMTSHCNCSHHDRGRRGRVAGRTNTDAVVTPPSMSMTNAIGITMTLPEDGRAPEHPGPSADSELAPERNNLHRQQTTGTDAGNRRRVAQVLTGISNFFGTASADRFDDSEFRTGKARDFPEIPGEENRNRDLSQIRDRYNMQRDEHGNATPDIGGRRSRASSFHGSVTSGPAIASTSLTAARAIQDSLSPPSSPPLESYGPQALGHETDEKPSKSPTPGCPSSPTTPGNGDRLTVPTSLYLSAARNSAPPSSTSFITTSGSPGSPTVVVSSESEDQNVDRTGSS